jgi:Transposase zinc-binding domain
MTESASLHAVLRRCLDDYGKTHRLSPHQWQVCRPILDCRTEVLGGFELEGDHCHDRPLRYHACRDRHGPRCQRQASAAWCEHQQAAVLPVTYYHLVFTLPQALDPWVQRHPEVI